jgi:phosphatidylinositol phospholipase C delta
VKGKKLPAARNEDGRILSDREEEEEEEEEEETVEAAEQRRQVSELGGDWILLQSYGWVRPRRERR